MDGHTITNFVAVTEDVTVHREREEQLRQAQKMEAVRQLTGGIAHDFNNLLAIVMGNLQLLEGIVGNHGEAREYLDDAIWSTKRSGELTRRLMAFARKQPLKPAVVDLNDVVKGMEEIRASRPTAAGAGPQVDQTLLVLGARRRAAGTARSDGALTGPKVIITGHAPNYATHFKVVAEPARERRTSE